MIRSAVKDEPELTFLKRSFWLGFVLLAALGLYSCTSGGGKPPGPPSPPPSNTKYDSLLLSAKGKAFVDTKGQPVEVLWFTGCCVSFDPEPEMAFSLATKEYIDYILAAGYGPNVVYHMRLGPWIPAADWPPPIVASGGAYLQVDGKADLTQWNPKFWAFVEELLEYGGSKGVRFEIDIADGWGFKLPENQMERNNPGYHPWIARNNVQNLNVYEQAGKVEIRANGDEINQFYERWVRKVVEVTGRYSNVVYQDGNEIVLVPGYSQAWTAGMANVVRDEEAKRGYKRHPFGSNAARPAHTLPQVDYVTVHQTSPMTVAECGGDDKPCANTEFNPRDPFSPNSMRTLQCMARSIGFFWGYWRHGQSTADALATWKLMGQPCTESKTGCFDIPNEDAVKVEPRPGFAFQPQVNAILAELFPSGQVPIQQKAALLQIAEKGRQTYPNLCFGVQTDTHGFTDQICVGANVGGRATTCQGAHVVNCLPETVCKPSSCPEESPDCCCDRGTVKRLPQAYDNCDTWTRP